MVEFKTFYFYHYYYFYFTSVCTHGFTAVRPVLKEIIWKEKVGTFSSLYFSNTVSLSLTHIHSVFPFSLSRSQIWLKKKRRRKNEYTTSSSPLIHKIQPFLSFCSAFPLTFSGKTVVMEIWAILLQTPTQIRICGSHGNEAAELVNWHPPVLVNTWYTDMEAHQDFSQHCVLLHNLLAYACMLMM